MVEFQSGGSIEKDLKKFKSNLNKKAGGKLNGPKDLKTAQTNPVQPNHGPVPRGVLTGWGPRVSDSASPKR